MMTMMKMNASLLLLLLLPSAALGFALSKGLQQQQSKTVFAPAATGRPALTNLHYIHSSPYDSYSADSSPATTVITASSSSAALFDPRIIPASQGLVLTESNQQQEQQQQKSSSNSQQKRPSSTSRSSSSSFHARNNGSSASTATASSLLNNRHSASDWWYNVRSLPHSKVLREVRSPVLAVAGWSLVVSVLYKVLSSSSSSSSTGWMSSMASAMCIPATAHGFLVSALGLLLVFRTNSAYQRFYEGRKIWQDVLSIARNLSRTLHLYTNDVGVERKQYMLQLLAAYPYLLRHHIRPGCLCENKPTKKPLDEQHRLVLREPAFVTVETRYEGDSLSGGQTTAASSSAECWVDRRKLPWCLFSSAPTASSSPSSASKKQGRRHRSASITSDLDQIASARNRPLWICDKIARQVVSIPYSDNFTSRERLALLSQVDKLTNAIGQCERIQQTAVPLNYARHSLRSLTLWLFTLPFCMVKDLGLLLTAPATAGIAWLLLGVYQIGYSIEDPFAGSLRLSILCDAIRRDVLEDNSKVNNNLIYKDEEDFEDEQEDEQENDVLTTTPPRTIFEDSDFLPAAPITMKQVNGQWAVVANTSGAGQ
jgi:predicted membrane chloride channel (bestrophin family)